MSDEEKTSAAAPPSMVVVAPTSVDRDQRPYRLTELEESAELQAKRNKIPGIPSESDSVKHGSHVKETKAEKDKNAGGHLNEPTNAKESKVSSEKNKQSLSKKISIAKRRSSSPESAKMTSSETENKSSVLTRQPIPEQLVPTSADLETPTKPAEDTVEDENIAEEIEEDIAELPSTLRKPTWEKEDNTGLKNIVTVEVQTEDLISCGLRRGDEVQQCSTEVQLEVGDGKEAIVLERKASIGPYWSRTPHSGPSGIFLCVPKRSLDLIEQPGIKVTISKKSLASRSSVLTMLNQDPVSNQAIKVEPTFPYLKTLCMLRSTYDVLKTKLRTTFSIK